MVEMKTVIPKIDEDTGVAWLTFNRPEKKNAMSRGLMAEMIALLKELRDNDKIRCIVTTGAGNSYSSGLIFMICGIVGSVRGDGTKADQRMRSSSFCAPCRKSPSLRSTAGV